MRSRLAVVLAALWGSAASAHAAEPGAVLVREGVPAAVILLPADPEPDEVLASRELQDHIERMSGAVLDIAGPHPPPGMAVIRIGHAPVGSAAPDGPGDDSAAFTIGVSSGEVRLTGRSAEGALFATYALLEQLGVRWYMPGDLGTVVPRRATVVLPAGHSGQRPSFAHRHLQAVSRDLPWYRRQRLGGLYFPGSHGIGLLPPADLEREPELFSLVDGQRVDRQLCVSNPEVVRRATAYALDYFATNPEAPWLGQGPSDGGGFCECAHCRALDSGEWDPYAAEPSVTDRYIWLFNRILSAVHERYPDKKLAFYAYHAYQLPPRRYTPDPHIVPAFAPINLCRIHGMSNPVCPDCSFYHTLMAEWGRLLPDVFERGYYFNLADPGLPFSKVHAVRDETPQAYGAGISGWRVECMPSWVADTPTLWVAARLMWDVKADVDALLREFYTGFFGPAVGPMGAYLELVDTAFRDTDCHAGSSFCLPAVFPPARVTRARALLEEAARLAAGHGRVAQRVQAYRLNHDRLEAFLDAVAARNRFDFATAQQQLDRVRALTAQMLDFRLYPNPSGVAPVGGEYGPHLDEEARLLWWRSSRSYVERFWAPCIESGYERLGRQGELVAGLPDAWDFLLDPTGVGEAAGWQRDGALGGGWQSAPTVSATWSEQGLHYYKGVAWYRTEVDVPQRFAGRRVYLWFGGVDEAAQVWLNGHLLGTSAAPGEGLPGAAGTFNPFEFDVTEVCRAGAPNTVAVRITNQRVNEVGTGGIVSPVMLWSPWENED